MKPPHRWGDDLAKWAAALTWCTFVLAIGAAVTALFGSALEGPGRPDPASWISVGVDRLTLVLLVLVTGVSAVVQSFGRRYLRGEPFQVRFVVLTVALTVACAALVSAATLVTFTLAWVASGLLIVGLAGLGPAGGPDADDRRLLRRSFLVGDVSLVAAAVIVSSVVGNVQLRDPGDAAGLTQLSGPWAVIAAVLIVVAACARCALIPFSSWLPTTLGAPTPVSALLHAGAVNGGGLLVIRATPILDGWWPSWLLLVAFAATTAVTAAALMTVSVDVKGSLVRSTSAQMGFMIATIAAGLPAAAAAHLVAHGLFKAALFLGSGSVVHDLTSHRLLPPASEPPSRRQDLVALIAPGAAIVLTVAALDPTGIALEIDPAKVALGAFAWATASIVLRGWLRRGAGTGRDAAVATAAVVGSTAVYVAGVALFTEALAPSLPVPTSGPGAWAFAPLAAGLIAVTVLRTRVPASSRWHRRAYVTLLSRTHAPGVRRGTRSTSRRPVPSPTTRSEPIVLAHVAPHASISPSRMESST